VTTRREFLRVTASGVVVLTLAPACGDDAGGSGGPAPHVLPDELPDPEGVDHDALLAAWAEGADVEGLRALGAEYAAQLGSGDALKAAFEAALAPVAEAEDVPAALAALGEAIEADFAAVRLVSLHGWQLGETELGLCALLHNAA